MEKLPPISAVYREFYGLDIRLLPGGNIQATSTRELIPDKAEKYIDWLKENKPYVVERLKEEGRGR